MPHMSEKPKEPRGKERRRTRSASPLDPETEDAFERTYAQHREALERLAKL